MATAYEVGFKDVYPWVWSVMFGVALTLAERRGAFQASGTSTGTQFWRKNVSAVFCNVGLPAVFFGLTMIRVGPKYPASMDFWQILGSLYLAGLPLGAHHIWWAVAVNQQWLPEAALQRSERRVMQLAPGSILLWGIVAFGIPALSAVLGVSLPF